MSTENKRNFFIPSLPPWLSVQTQPSCEGYILVILIVILIVIEIQIDYDHDQEHDYDFLGVGSGARLLNFHLKCSVT